MAQPSNAAIAATPRQREQRTDAERLAQLLKILENRADADYDAGTGRYHGNPEMNVLSEYTAWLEGNETSEKAIAVVAEAGAMAEALRELNEAVEAYLSEPPHVNLMNDLTEKLRRGRAILARIDGAA